MIKRHYHPLSTFSRRVRIARPSARATKPDA
jgi:hypothetical protein